MKKEQEQEAEEEKVDKENGENDNQGKDRKLGHEYAEMETEKSYKKRRWRMKETKKDEKRSTQGQSGLSRITTISRYNSPPRPHIWRILLFLLK